jgi:hypothetical protein
LNPATSTPAITSTNAIGVTSGRRVSGSSVPRRSLPYSAMTAGMPMSSRLRPIARRKARRSCSSAASRGVSTVSYSARRSVGGCALAALIYR